MKRILTFILLALLCSTNVLAQDEMYKIVMERRLDKQDEVNKVMTYIFTKDKLRLEYTQPNSSFPDVIRIVDAGKNEVSVLFPVNSMAITGPLPELGLGEMAGLKTRWTEEETLVSDCHCKQMLQNHRGGSLRALICPEIEFDYNKMVSAVLGVEEVVIPGNQLGFPLEWTFDDDEEGKRYHVRLLNKNKITLDEDLFLVPKSYSTHTR